jgi:preprotein translocase subunit SecG
MYYLFLIVHVVVCLFLIIVVLLQSGKAADLAGAFGGMGSQTAFGPRGSATLLSKATTISAVLFMITSMGLSLLATRQAGLGASVLEEQRQTVPAKSAPAPVGIPAQAPIPGQQPKPNTGQIPIPAPNNQSAPAPAAPSAPKK